MRHTRIASAGVHLDVANSGDPDAATIILVHGFPDNKTVWDLVVPHLESQFHVVTYDVRGAGASTAPADTSGYRVDRLIDDLVAVIDRSAPDGEAVHLVGHDWGSVQLWSAVMSETADARLNGRIASFTSISGPGLDLFGHFFLSSLKRRDLAAVVRQIAHSWYIGFFQLPVLPELAFRRLGGPLRKRLAATQRLREVMHWRDTFGEDGAHGVNLYRANGLASQHTTTQVPIQLIVPTKDAFLTPAIYTDIALFAPHTTRVDVVAGHWVLRTHPELIADRIAQFARTNQPN